MRFALAARRARPAASARGFFLFQICLIGPVHAAKKYVQVEVVDPFIELRTGPGRGYPVFYIAERGEKVEILKRRTDWFKVRTQRGKAGWVDRTQMANTLVDAGVKKSFRDVFLQKHLRRRFEVSFAAGSFDEDPVLKVRAGLSVNRYFAVELSVGQISGDFASSTQIDANVVAEPFRDWRASPFFTLGVGQFRSTPKGTIVQGTSTRDTAINAGLGVHVRLTRKLAFRADWWSYVVLIDDNRSDNFQELTVGFAFLF
ncbi:MAG: outer membrane beta-barrel protein [Acidiferrobacterales bacterium]